jgi:hypothetical protein
MLRIWIRLDPHYFGKMDPDPHQSEAGSGSWYASNVKWDLKRDKSHNSKAVRGSKWMEDRGRSDWRSRGIQYGDVEGLYSVSHHFDEKQDPDSRSESKFLKSRVRIPIKVKPRLRIRIKFKKQITLMRIRIARNNIGGLSCQAATHLQL